MRSTDTRSVLWVDAYGRKTITRINSVAGFAAGFAALTACSNAAWQEYWESALSTNVPTPAASVYQSVMDRAALLFLCVDNTLAQVIIPAPNLGIFLADGETIDPANALVVALVAAILGVLTNQNASPAASFVAGYRLPRAQSPL